MDAPLRKLISLGFCVVFLITYIPVSSVYGNEINLPKPGVMVRLSLAFNPPVLKGIKVHPDNPFRFDFILDVGNGLKPFPTDMRNESTKLIKYFLASLTVPEKDLWVNLSPYEKDRIVPDAFGQTEMGRDLLAQDYMLKQITASLIYPESEIGKKFWKRVYGEAVKKFGSTNIPVNTFNKVWIVPEKAIVFENAKAGTAYVVESKLKVMLEEDYLATEKNQLSPTLSLNKREGGHDSPSFLKRGLGGVKATQGTNETKSSLKEIIIPILTKEVNEGKNFAQLRQVYNSLILGIWFKDKIKASIFGKAYVDHNNISGVDIQDKTAKDKIWEQYVAAFKKGAYNYIKEDIDLSTGQYVPRKYFSGGAGLYRIREAYRTTIDSAQLPQQSSKSSFIVRAGIYTGKKIIKYSVISSLMFTNMVSESINVAFMAGAGAIALDKKVDRFVLPPDVYLGSFRASLAKMSGDELGVVIEKSLYDLMDLSKVKMSENELMPRVIKIRYSLLASNYSGGNIENMNALMHEVVDLFPYLDKIATNSVSVRWILYHDIKSIILGQLLRGAWGNIKEIDVELLGQFMDMLEQVSLSKVESSSAEDLLFKKYFPRINQADLISDANRINARNIFIGIWDEIQENGSDEQKLIVKKHEKLAAKNKQYGHDLNVESNADISFLPPAYQVMAKFYVAWGLVPWQLERPKEYLPWEKDEVKDIGEIPLEWLYVIQKLRTLSNKRPDIINYIHDSAKAHDIPPFLLIAHIVGTEFLAGFKQYSVLRGLHIAVNRGRISPQNRDKVEKLYKSLGFKDFAPSVSQTAFMGGVVGGAQSMMGLTFLRAVDVKIYDGWARFGQDAKHFSNQRISWGLLDDQWNIEAASVKIAGAIQDVGDFRNLAIYGTATRRHPEQFTDQSKKELYPYLLKPETAQYVPDPSVFGKNAFMLNVLHPNGDWYRSSYKPHIIKAIVMSHVLDNKKTIITDVNTIEDMRQVIDLLMGSDSYMQEVAKRTLRSIIAQGPLELVERAKKALGEDRATLVNDSTPGGIDLTSNKMGIKVQKVEQGAEFKFDSAMIQQLQNGSSLTPVVFEISPMIDLPLFLGVVENKQKQTPFFP